MLVVCYRRFKTRFIDLTKTFEKEVNFRAYFSGLWRFVRTVWFNTTLFNKSNGCSLITSQASMCLCIIYVTSDDGVTNKASSLFL